jgi:hypothetical protein
MWQTNPHLRSEAPEPGLQNVTGKHTVTIVIAIDRDPLLFFDCHQNPIDRGSKIRYGEGIIQIAEGWLPEKLIDVPDVTSDQDIEQRLA